MDLQSIETDYIGLKELLDYLHGEDNIVKNKDANHRTLYFEMTSVRRLSAEDVPSGSTARSKRDNYLVYISDGNHEFNNPEENERRKIARTGLLRLIGEVAV